MKLMWDNWYRSKGAKEHMPKKSFAGKNFGSIFWDAMRLVFYDEHNKPGLLYQGVLYPLAEQIIAANGGRRGFNEMDEIAMLKLGNFKYREFFFPPLRFEGPEKEDIGKQWGEAPIGGSEVDVGFYDIVDTALNGTGLLTALTFPQNQVGLRMITYFTGAYMLHEIMHNHGFKHPDAVNWTPGSVYASTLPHVACLAVLMASPEWNLFQPAIGAGFPTGGYSCCGTPSEPTLTIPAPPKHQFGWKWCKNCEALFFGGDIGGSLAKSRCPVGGAHVQPHIGEYYLTIDTPSDPGQHFWRWCHKCSGLFYSGHGAGKCPALGEHDGSGSADYSLMQNVGTFQNNWRWCNKCQGLFFAGHGAGVCPATGGHALPEQTGSGDYSVPTRQEIAEPH